MGLPCPHGGEDFHALGMMALCLLNHAPSFTRASIFYFIFIGTWNVEGLNSERKQHEIGSMLRDMGLHIVAVQESHEHAASVVAVPGFRWFGRPRTGRSKGGVGFLVTFALILELEICEGCLHPEST